MPLRKYNPRMFWAMHFHYRHVTGQSIALNAFNISFFNGQLKNLRTVVWKRLHETLMGVGLFVKLKWSHKRKLNERMFAEG